MTRLDQPPSGWRVIDGNHRAAAFHESHRRRGAQASSVDLFVLTEPLA